MENTNRYLGCEDYFTILLECIFMNPWWGFFELSPTTSLVLTSGLIPVVGRFQLALIKCDESIRPCASIILSYANVFVSLYKGASRNWLYIAWTLQIFLLAWSLNANAHQTFASHSRCFGSFIPEYLADIYVRLYRWMWYSAFLLKNLNFHSDTATDKFYPLLSPGFRWLF